MATQHLMRDGNSVNNTDNPFPVQISQGGAPVTDANPLSVSQAIGGADISLANPLPTGPVVAGAFVSDANPLPSEPNLNSAPISAANPLPAAPIVAGAIVATANPMPAAVIVGGAAVADSNTLPVGLYRRTISSTLTILINTAISSAALDFRAYAGGILKLDAAGWTAADITFLVSETLAGVYVPLRDAAGTLIRLTNLPAAAVFTRPLPDEVFAAAYFKINSTNTASEADVNQAAARVVTVMLKG